MPSTTVYNMAGEAVEKLELSEQVFGAAREVLAHHSSVMAEPYLAPGRIPITTMCHERCAGWQFSPHYRIRLRMRS